MKLSGVMPALVTPFDANGQIDFKAFERLLVHLREAGVTGWVPNGSTGEYFSQSTEERRDVLQFVKDFAKPGEILIAGTNASANDLFTLRQQPTVLAGYVDDTWRVHPRLLARLGARLEGVPAANWGALSPDIAMNRTFSRQARSMARLEIMPRL